jgi:Tat protein secretion system quality control protein TatD with DNase activity
VQVVKDITKVLLDVIIEDDEMPLQVHLSCWSGTSDSMFTPQSLSDTLLYIGMNHTTGFAKAATAHACAFDVPLDRLLLETDNIIPAPITKSLCRKAFAHSGLVPYCAAAVAEQKKITPEEVARATSENT